MNLCRCIDCTKFDMRNASPGMAKLGWGVCPHSSAGKHVSALIARKCEFFNRAAAEVVTKREDWLRGKPSEKEGGGVL